MSLINIGSYTNLLPDNIDGPEKANFLKEIEMMKKVSGSNHDHQMFVVNMLGCVTIQEPMMLVLEYASHGDLLTYLRQSRGEVRRALHNRTSSDTLGRIIFREVVVFWR